MGIRPLKRSGNLREKMEAKGRGLLDSVRILLASIRKEPFNAAWMISVILKMISNIVMKPIESD